MVDFKRLQDIPIKQVADRLGYKLRRGGKQYRGPCLICHHKSQRAFSLTPELGRWWCFGRCAAGGDGLELVSRTLRISKPEAAEWMVENFGGSA